MTRKEILKKTINFDVAIHRLIRLEEENANLKCECRRCAYTYCPCVLSDFGKTRNGICDHFKNVFDENVELKESKKMLEQGYVWHDYDAGEDSYEDSHEGKWVKRDDVQRLNKAKEIIKELLDNCFGYNSKTVNYAVKAKAEQFLKEE